MGYFSNGTEGDFYYAKYCEKCVNQGPDDGPGCWIWLQHLLMNYKECNNTHHYLHVLIPRTKDGDNDKCVMFRPIDEVQRGS